MAGDLDKRGTLYVVAVGVDKYPGLKGSCTAIAGAPDCDLHFAGSDAASFAEAVKKGLGPRNRKVVRRVLRAGKKADGPPDRDAILRAFKLLQTARPNDTVVVYLAGRGLSKGLSYRFLPGNATLENGRPRPGSVVSWFEIREAMDSARGRRFLFLDTFRSGKVFNPRLDSDVYHAGIITYTSARNGQQAVVNKKTGHGLFAAAIVAGLHGAADHNQDKLIRADELGGFVKQTVMEHAAALRRAQEPRMYLGRDSGNVLLLRLK